MAINDYLGLIPKALSNPKLILEGWLNDIKMSHGDLPEDEVLEIIKRRSVCHSCPLNSDNAKTSQEYKELFNKHYENSRRDLHCSLCECNVAYKTAQLKSNCGIESFNKQFNKNLTLKWTSYDKTSK